ncbi:hypothetical protein NKG94_34025 [Micromonospora sp. M12]
MLRKLVYYVASTVDGFIAGPDGADPTGPGGFWPVPEDYLHHLVAEYPETLPGPARQAFGIVDEGSRFDTVLEGRHSYEVGLKAGVTDAYPICGTWSFPARWVGARTRPSRSSTKTPLPRYAS